MKHIISLGAGVQSSTMALMAAHGEIGPMPECAIFADTGWEPKAVYEWLDWLEQQLPFPVHRVQLGNIRDDALRARCGGLESEGSRAASMPYFMGVPGKVNGMIRRQCTREYKIDPIQRKIRELIGLVPRQRAPKSPVVTQWIGISLDEVQRIKPSRVAYIENIWPLVDMRMSRADCFLWMERNGYPKPAKSACIGCPYRDDRGWREMRDNYPEEWEEAVEFDRQIRDHGKLETKAYLHRSCVPLGQVDLSTAEDRGQADMFNNECEGMCGV